MDREQTTIRLPRELKEQLQAEAITKWSIFMPTKKRGRNEISSDLTVECQRDNKIGEEMKTDTHRLKVLMYDRGETHISISQKLNVDRSTFARWGKNNFETMPLRKVYELVELLNLDDDEVSKVFFLKENEDVDRRII